MTLIQGFHNSLQKTQMKSKGKTRLSKVCKLIISVPPRLILIGTHNELSLQLSPDCH